MSLIAELKRRKVFKVGAASVLALLNPSSADTLVARTRHPAMIAKARARAVQAC